jgi:hypothetical protein
MDNAKRLPLWKQSITISPSVAKLLGVAGGCLCTILSALAPPRDFSCGFLATISLFFVPFGGSFGYILWLCGDRSRRDRFLTVWSRAFGVIVVGLLIAFPFVSLAWWQVLSSMEPRTVLMLIGVVCSMAMFAVGAGWGIVHAVDSRVAAFRHSSKPGADFRTDGIWDRELDHR